ncbi:hypothetical protein OG736_25050 [Streptomyces sp. NBC_01334]|nr:hypothetical protein OG736_25050 [Streptomyces sp. NBC_01334]
MNIILPNRPGGQGLDLTGLTDLPDRRGLAVPAPAHRTPAPGRPRYGAPPGPVVVERNDLGIRHR